MCGDEQDEADERDATKELSNLPVEERVVVFAVEEARCTPQIAELTLWTPLGSNEQCHEEEGHAHGPQKNELTRRPLQRVVVVALALHSEVGEQVRDGRVVRIIYCNCDA